MAARFSSRLRGALGQVMVSKADPVGCSAHQSCFVTQGMVAIAFSTDLHLARIAR
jgi:hypothetical protein